MSRHTLPGSDGTAVVRPSRGVSRRGATLAAALVLGLVASGAMVWHGSEAAFTANTSNGANSWASGSVSITDNDSDGVLFNVTGLVPGVSETKCIAVNYGGTVAAPIKLYATGPSDTGLAADIDLVIDVANADGSLAFGSSAGCNSLVATNKFTGTLATFNTNRTNYANGVVTDWAPTAAATRVFRIKYTFNSGSNAQSKSAGTTFTWEAQNT